MKSRILVFLHKCNNMHSYVLPCYRSSKCNKTFFLTYFSNQTVKIVNGLTIDTYFFKQLISKYCASGRRNCWLLKSNF